MIKRVSAVTLRNWIFIGLFVIAAAYFSYQAGDVLFSPALVIFEPQNGVLFNRTEIEVAGRTDPGLEVRVMGKEMKADENGNFKVIVFLSPGYNAIGVSVKDHFDNETRKVLKVVVK
ncbi:hypothetical protein HYT01_01365 [Candidatus Giovannonibacteria bacterium]|nr:hypothetical protein [Candidatus Giovannonibacteria bacterium]